MIRILIIISIALLQGCNLTDPNEMRTLSQSQTKCDYKGIKISNIRQLFSGGVEWIASCNGQNFICHYEVDREKSLRYQAVMAGSCKKTLM